MRPQTVLKTMLSLPLYAQYKDKINAMLESVNKP
jgi:hypothetical protein